MDSPDPAASACEEVVAAMLQAKAFVEDGDAFGRRLPRWWHLWEAVVAHSMVCSGRKPQILPGLDNDGLSEVVSPLGALSWSH